MNRAATSAIRPARFGNNNDKIDEDENQEDDETDDVIAAHDEIAESFDNVARVAIQQNKAGGSYIEGQPVQRDKEEQGRESGKFCRGPQVKNDQQCQQGKADADGQEQVEDDRCYWQNEQQNRAKQPGDEPP